MPAEHDSLSPNPLPVQAKPIRNYITPDSLTPLTLAAHQEEDFKNLFSYVPSGGWHFLAFDVDKLVSHAMVTTRWLQPEGHPLLKTAYIDAVSTLPAYQGQGYGSALMKRLASDIDPV